MKNPSMTLIISCTYSPQNLPANRMARALSMHRCTSLACTRGCTSCRGFLLKPFGIGRESAVFFETCTQICSSAIVFQHKPDLYGHRLTGLAPLSLERIDYMLLTKRKVPTPKFTSEAGNQGYCKLFIVNILRETWCQTSAKRKERLLDRGWRGPIIGQMPEWQIVSKH